MSIFKKNLSRNPSSTLDTILESQLLNIWLTTIALFFQNRMPLLVCSLACIGVLTTIHRKRFYHNFILINMTLLLAYFSSIYSCLFLYNNVSKKQEHLGTSVFFFETLLNMLKFKNTICSCYNCVINLCISIFDYYIFGYAIFFRFEA